jgi:predicted phage terminase large subunit-like protein
VGSSIPPLDEIQRVLAERSLADFIRIGWRYIDPNDYVTNWHIDAICEHLEAVSRGEIKRLIINVPPRHMKSISVSVAWPAWTWIQDDDAAPLLGPRVQFLATSYAHSLSIRDSVKCRRVIESPWYKENWGERFSLTSDQNTKIRFDNDRQGYRIATSVEGTATGEGGDIVLVDDPLSAGDAQSPNARQAVIDWWDEVMSTRLNDPKSGAYVVIMQRLHERDLVGHILGRESDWTHLCLPARYEQDHPYLWPGDPRTKAGELLWPERIGEPELKKLETALGSYNSAGQLQQRPAPRDGGMFKRAWFKIIEAAPASRKKVRKWDLAATEDAIGADPDWTVGVLMSQDDAGFFTIEDVERLRGSAHEVERTIENTASRDGVSVAIHLNQDPGQAGKAQVAALVRKLAGYNVRSDLESGSKETRATPFSAQCEAGNVRLVKAGWNDAFLDEISSFPNAAHDDQVDASAGAFNFLAPGSGIEGYMAYYDKVLAGTA